MYFISNTKKSIVRIALFYQKGQKIYLKPFASKIRIDKILLSKNNLIKENSYVQKAL